MPAAGGQTTRNLRGAGANIKAASAQAELDGLDYRACKLTRLWWLTSDNEVLTPGSGGIPNRVIGMAWEPIADNQNANVYWNRSTRTGIVAASGAYNGYLLVFSR